MAQEDLASILRPPLDPEVNMDIVRRSLMQCDHLRSVVSPSVATAHEGPRPLDTLITVEDSRGDEDERLQELQRSSLPTVSNARSSRP